MKKQLVVLFLLLTLCFSMFIPNGLCFETIINETFEGSFEWDSFSLGSPSGGVSLSDVNPYLGDYCMEITDSKFYAYRRFDTPITLQNGDEISMYFYLRADDTPNYLTVGWYSLYDDDEQSYYNKMPIGGLRFFTSGGTAYVGGDCWNSQVLGGSNYISSGADFVLGDLGVWSNTGWVQYILHWIFDEDSGSPEVNLWVDGVLVDTFTNSVNDELAAPHAGALTNYVSIDGIFVTMPNLTYENSVFVDDFYIEYNLNALATPTPIPSTPFEFSTVMNWFLWAFIFAGFIALSIVVTRAKIKVSK
jgi:hypothetical protein